MSPLSLKQKYGALIGLGVLLLFITGAGAYGAISTQRIMADDGMSLGVAYTGARAPFRPPMGVGRLRPADLEAQFAL